MVDLVSMSRGFLSDMGGDVIVGREFDSRDRADSPPVGMVNEAFATQYFAGRTPIGERIAFRTGPESSVEWRTIVGVAGNINHSATRGENSSWRPTLYMPLGQRTPPYFTIGLRGGGTPIEQSRILRETVQTLDADLPVYYVRPLDKAQSDARAGYQLGAVTLLGFSAIGFVLAIFGLYAVLAFTVGQRTREIGIRRALGAGNWQIAEFVLKGTASQLIIGLVLGAVLTPYAVRHAITLMEGLPVSSAATYLIAFGGAILIALVASVPPALRALQVQPADVIRSE
jgi:putative ABC transport system permease protein